MEKLRDAPNADRCVTQCPHIELLGIGGHHLHISLPAHARARSSSRQILPPTPDLLPQPLRTVEDRSGCSSTAKKGGQVQRGHVYRLRKPAARPRWQAADRRAQTWARLLARAHMTCTRPKLVEAPCLPIHSLGDEQPYLRLGSCSFHPAASRIKGPSSTLQPACEPCS